MEQQKRIALINDVTGFGRCSTAVQLPIISAMGVQCCVMPTAILSAHTGYPSYYFDDYTRHMREYMDNWKELGVRFDGISTGFLGSTEQIELVIEFIEHFKEKNTIVLIDPVMGDDGKLYATYTDEMCHEMKKLVQYADVLTPNLTEACRLLNLSYPERIPKERELQKIAEEFCKQGTRKVVITGLEIKDQVLNYYYEKNGRSGFAGTKKVAEGRPGTGDVFSAVLTGAEVKNMDLKQAVDMAANFIQESLVYTMELGTPHNDGICFEPFLKRVMI